MLEQEATMNFRAITAIFIAVILLVPACSNSSSPVHNGIDEGLTNGANVETALFPTENNHNLLGYWMFYVDPDNDIIEPIQLRSSDVHLNVLTWLENAPCSNCLKITNFNKPTPTQMDVEITFTHPFTNDRFTGFDVRGIVMFEGNLSFPSMDLMVSNGSDGNPELINPDGFTTLYNPGTAGNGLQGYVKGKLAPGFAAPNATLNAFKAYYSNENRRYYAAGDALAQTFMIQLPGGPFTFGYAVDTSWAAPSDPITVPDSFPIAANCPEAYQIVGSMDGPLALTAGAKASLTIDVYDWQGPTTINKVEVEGPLFFNGIVTATEGTGGPGTKRFIAELVNEFGFVPQGKYPVCIRVMDTSSAPGALIDNIGYTIYDVQVKINHPPVCMADVSNFDPNPAETITFTDTSTDDEGPADLDISEWDWDNDGTWDETGFEVTHSFPSDGVYYVNHRMTDKAGASDTLDNLLAIDVGLFVTLQEDLDAKAIGTTYKYQSETKSYNSGLVINVDDVDGPWDFTAAGLTLKNNRVTVIDDDDPEVGGFVDDFNSATTHFMKSFDMYDPFFPILYEAQYHHFSSNKLFIYGFHDPLVIGSSPFGPPDTEQALAIPFPLTTSTDYMFDIDLSGFILDYHVKAIGEGDVTVPYDGGTTYHCILIRYRFWISSADPLNGGTLNFAFINDSGVVVANVIAVNDPPVLNWVPTTNKIIPDGTVLFQALDTIEPGG